MVVSYEEGIFQSTTIERSIPAGGTLTIEIPYKPGSDMNLIRKIEKSCNCTEPEIWRDKLLVNYTDDGNVKGEKQIKELFLYPIYWDADKIGDVENSVPLTVVNAAQAEVFNWANLKYQEIKILITVTK